MRADSEEHRRQDNGGADRLLGVRACRADRKRGGAMMRQSRPIPSTTSKSVIKKPKGKEILS